MRYQFFAKATKKYNKMPALVQKKFIKQLNLLLGDPSHPSLNSKKYKGSDDLWQARVDKNYRFYYQKVDDVYFIVAITNHPK